MLIVAILMFILALVVGAVAVAGITGRLPRNRWAGVRTAATLASDDAFRLANKIAGPTLIAAALLLVIGGIGALVFDSVGGSIVVVVVASLVAAAVAAVGGITGARTAAAIAPAGGCEDCDCGSAHEPTDDAPDDVAAADECGEVSCGSCTLRNACQPG